VVKKCPAVPNSKTRFRLYKSPPLVPVLSQINPVTPSYLNKCIFIQWQKNLVSFYSLNYRTSRQNPFNMYTSVPERSLTSYMLVCL